MRILFLAALSYIALSVGLWAQDPGSKKQLLNAQDGMLHRWVKNVVQDSHGLLWINTYEGLNRYDGHRFKVYRHAPDNPHSLRNNAILTLDADEDGRVWCTTYSGLSIYDPQTDNFRNYENDTFFSDSTESRQLLFTHYIGNKRMFALFHTGSSHRFGIFDRSPTKFRLLNSHIRSPNRIWFIPNPSGPITLLDNDGYFYLDIQTDRITRVTLGEPGLRWTAAYFPTDEQGRFWFPDGNTFACAPLPRGVKEAEHIYLHHDHRSRLFLTYPDGEVFLLDRPNRQFRLLVREETFATCFIDRHQLVWIGSQQGLTKILKTNRSFSLALNKPFDLNERPPISFSCREMAELDPESVFAISHELNARFVSDEGCRRYPALCRFFAETSTYPPVRSKAGALYFISVYKGEKCLIEYAPNRDALKRIPLPPDAGIGVEDIPWMFEDAKGAICILTQTNYSYDPKSGDFTRMKNNIGIKYFASQDPQNRNILYIIDQQDRALFAYDINKTKKIWTYSLAHIAPGENYPYKMVISHGGWIWTTTTEGLLRLNPRDFSTKFYTRAHGLSDRVVYSIYPDGDYLWLGTANGLCRFHIRDETTLNFFLEDGLAHNEFNSRATLQTSDGRIWMGGLNGINIFNPRELEDYRPIPPRIGLSYCIWTNASGAQVEVNPFLETEIVVSPGYINLIFRFFLDNYAQPQSHKFSYWLEGVDKGWTPWESEPNITFQRLLPGTYQLRIRGMDERGIVSENEVTLRFRILQVWWLRPWAKALYAAIIFFLAYRVFRFELRRRLEHAENTRLKELDVLKNRLYANITHEFRTPLTLILGPAERALKKPEVQAQPEIYHTLQTIGLNARRLLTLVGQMLDLRKMEEKNMKVNWVQGDLVQLLRMLADSFGSLAYEKGTRLNFESPIKALRCDYDRDKILKICGNLLSNAFKFTPAGGRITFSLLTLPDREPEPQWIQIVVRDTGIGISAEELPHIFGRFYQADNRHSRSGEGTGIGLTLVKEFTELLGGKVSVESQPGAGACFTITLPYRSPQSEPDWRENPPTSLASKYVPATASVREPAAVPRLNTPLVLIVEDNPDIARYIGLCLAPSFRIEYAGDGREGLEKALTISPDLIISDLMMPYMDGLQLVDALKSDMRVSHIPIVLLTAKADVQDRIKGLQRGADAYLTKPFNEEELVVTAHKLIELREALRRRYTQEITPIPGPPVASKEDYALEDAFYLQLLDFFEKNYMRSELNMDELYREMAMSHTQLHRKLAAIADKTPVQLLREIRIKKAAAMLKDSKQSVAEVAWACGFNDPAYFSRIFTREKGVSPAVWRQS